MVDDGLGLPPRRPSAEMMLQLGAIADRAYKANPTDIDEIAKAVRGAQKLLGFVADDLEKLDDDKITLKTINLLTNGLQAMVEARQKMVWTHVMSGQAADAMLEGMREAFAPREEGHKP